MERITPVAAMRAWSRDQRQAGKRIALVPTMGALHEGHLALVDRARELADVVIVSIYVNPTQFDDPSDLEHYPRSFDNDLALLQERGVEAVFAPETKEMFPDGFSTFVDVVGSLTDKLCGMARPGHLRGVATVCTKLFIACDPDVAVFGQKDLQQALMIGRLIGDLNLGIELSVVPTVREADGLALSSRNRRMDQAQRLKASALPQSLDSANLLYLSGTRAADKLVNAFAEEVLQQPGIDVDYADIVDLDGFKHIVDGEANEHCILAVAIIVEGVRLIDHIHLGAPDTLVPTAAN